MLLFCVLCSAVSIFAWRDSGL